MCQFENYFPSFFIVVGFRQFMPRVPMQDIVATSNMQCRICENKRLTRKSPSWEVHAFAVFSIVKHGWIRQHQFRRRACQLSDQTSVWLQWKRGLLRHTPSLSYFIAYVRPSQHPELMSRAMFRCLHRRLKCTAGAKCTLMQQAGNRYLAPSQRDMFTHRSPHKHTRA